MIWPINNSLLGDYKPVIKVSFSGGKTSAFMAKKMKDELSHLFKFIFVFSNTGEEDERTLVFADRCDKEWNLDLVWLEAVVSQYSGQGTTHKIVSFETASRNSEPFIEVIKKYGIPNVDFQPCNRELKLRPMDSYMRELGVSEYYTAIGIRIDEVRRVNESEAKKHNIVYPLIDLWPTDKQDIFDFWENQDFQLGLEEHEGNCKTCWKKSLKKHLLLIAEQPKSYDFNRRMEEEYGWHGAPYYGIPSPIGKKRVFFREHRSTMDLFALANEIGDVKLGRAIDGRSAAARQGSLDFEAGGCGESCEPYLMGNDK